MTNDIKNLVASWPGDDLDEAPQQALERMIQALSKKSPPLGSFNRMWILGALPAKIAVSYFYNWFKSRMSDSSKKNKQLNETHFKAAIKLLGSMSYLKGAIMKAGQIMAFYPDVLPDQFVEVMGRLHFEAPPMHFSLLRELVRNELGADPEELFDRFETKAFAAASLGQVHRAWLKHSKKKVAVKIQYPNIGKTISSDFKNLHTLLLPMRLRSDWDSLKFQFADIKKMLDLEVDYINEARNMEIARAVFTKEDRIVVPKVYKELSSRRVLTMDFLEGVHMEEYLNSHPPQDQINDFGFLICKSSFRLSYKANMLHADPHPGNYFFMPDGRLGFIDFGCCRNYTQEEIDYMARIERAGQGTREELTLAMAEGNDLTPKEAADKNRQEFYLRWCDWLWDPMFTEGPFDFGDPAYFKEGMDLYREVLKKGYLRSRPTNTWLTKCFFGVRALLSRLKANTDFRKAWRQETWVK